MNSDYAEKKKIYYAVFFPAVICFLVILVFLFERGMDLDFTGAGVFPREPKTMINIFTMPFIHADWSHLLNNIISFFVLSTSLYYFYNEIANKILILSVIFSGLFLWVIGRESWHIGLSGVIFSFTFFLFFSGVIRKHIPLIAIALIVVFLYGNNVWHLFPWQKSDPVSWEGHLAGAISGLILSVVYRKQGPQKPVPIWDEDEENEDEDEWKTESNEDNINQ
ncbi:MAG: rhomboid family intramembrane serine protease [Paludibacteraceae bacterium]